MGVYSKFTGCALITRLGKTGSVIRTQVTFNQEDSLRESCVYIRTESMI